jgi:hypothetical protein
LGEKRFFVPNDEVYVEVKYAAMNYDVSRRRRAFISWFPIRRSVNPTRFLVHLKAPSVVTFSGTWRMRVNVGNA